MDGSNGVAGFIPVGLLGGLDSRQPPMPSLHGTQRQQRMLPFQSNVNAEHSSCSTRHSSYQVPNSTRKQQLHHLLPTVSSEEEAMSFGDAEGDDGGASHRQQQAAAAATDSPWQRMKWTDNMVRLLINVVYRVGDEVEFEQQPSMPGNGAVPGKKKAVGSVSASASALMQKKGKWKSVSRAMMEKGFYVSPQQCEDKFNDLNKRYKRVIDLLGRGQACRVVENHALLETMDHLTPKAKDEARKLLNSKHLFFPEMCAYHNPAGHSSAAPPQNLASDQHCFHHPPGHNTEHTPPSVTPLKGAPEQDGDSSGDDFGSDEDDFDDDDQLDEEDEHEEDRKIVINKTNTSETTEEDSKLISGKKRKTTMKASSWSPPPMSPSVPSINVQQLRSELTAMGGGVEQQRQWLKRKAVELEEHKVEYEGRALELEKQRFKWQIFSAKKEREMERMKLDNDRQRLDNDRMLLILRQKQLELHEHNLHS